jgi:hypothetical protein
MKELNTSQTVHRLAHATISVKEEGGTEEVPTARRFTNWYCGKLVAVLKNAEEAEFGHRDSATEAAGAEIKKLWILKDIAIAE